MMGCRTTQRDAGPCHGVQDHVMGCRTTPWGVGPCDGAQDHAMGCKTMWFGAGPCPQGVQTRSGVQDCVMGCKAIWFGAGSYNTLGTSRCPGELGSTRVDISPGTEESEPALPTSTRPWGRRHRLGRDPTSQDPTPSPSLLIFPPLLITSGNHPYRSPRASAATAARGPPGPDPEQEHWSLPSPPPTWTWCHLLWGHWASPWSCGDAAYCRPGCHGAGYHWVLASWHWVPAAPGIMALGTTGCWHPGTGYHQLLASWHQMPPDPGIAVPGHPGAAARSILERWSRCRYLRSLCHCGTADCRCLLASIASVPMVGWEQSLAWHSHVLKAKLIARRFVGVMCTERKRLWGRWEGGVETIS